MRLLVTRRRYSIVAVLLAVAGIVLAPRASGAFRYLQEGMTALTVTGEDLLTQQPVTSAVKDGDGVVVVTFWATWSPRSLELLNDLKAMILEHPERRMKVIAVNVEDQQISPEMRKLITTTVRGLELPFSVVVDKGLSLFYEFGVIAVPSTAILDSTGALRFAPSGYSYTIRDRIVDTIEVLLGVKSPAEAAVVRKGYTPKDRASRYYHLALQMTNRRLYERALDNLEQAEEIDSLFSGPHNLRGQIYLKLDSVDAAAAEFAAAVRLDSTSVAAWAGWGRALLRQGRFDEAYETLRRTLREDDSYTPALLDLALCLSEQARIPEALDSLRAARELNPKDPVVHFYLGRVFRASNAIDSALASFGTALGLLYPPP